LTIKGTDLGDILIMNKVVYSVRRERFSSISDHLTCKVR